MIRSVIERVFRNTVIKRRLPSTFGSIPLYVSPDAQLKYLNVTFDDDLLRIVSAYVRNDSVVWDVGANVGVFTLAAAATAIEGQVIAIEPDIWLANLICKSLALNPDLGTRVRVLPAAFSDHNGAASFLIAKRGRASNALESAGGRSQMGGVREKAFVPTLTLDTLLDCCPAPTFIKIDVEGAELHVLMGGRRMLTEIRPMIYIEVEGSETQAVTALFVANNYALFDGAAPLAPGSRVSACTFNTLAIPEEQLSSLPSLSPPESCCTGMTFANAMPEERVPQQPGHDRVDRL